MNIFFTSLNKMLPSLSRLIGLLLLLSVSSMAVFGQGTVTGLITGADDSSPLFAATIVVKGTTTGTVSDYNGRYTLALKADTYVLEISYMGYELREETVTLQDGQLFELNVALSPATIMGEEVIITTQARGQLAAVNQQIRSNQIINVVSEERIRELPDQNAAQAISRLPGIHLDGSKVVIRGVEPKMNKIMINGVEMPSTEANDRATDLGGISAGMLSGIEVYKTLTPDMDADAIGGVVNLRLREASQGFHYSITAQGAYNQQEKIMGSYKFWGDVSNRFLDNRLGVLLNVNYETYRGGSDWIDVEYKELGSAPIGEGTYMFHVLDVYDQQSKRDNMGGALVVDFDLPKGQLVYSGMLSHSTPEQTRYRDNLAAGRQYRYPQVDHNKYTSLLLNNSLRYEQQIGIVRLDASISNVSIDREDEYRYSMRFANAVVSPFVDSLLTNAIKLKMEPWEVYSTINPGALDHQRGYAGTLTPNSYNEQQWLTDLNLSVPLRISDNIDIDFKVGGKYRRKERAFDDSYLQYYNNNVLPIHESIQPWLTSIGHEPDAGSLYLSDFRNYDYKPNEGFMNNSPYYNMDVAIDVDLADEMWLRQVNLGEGTLMNDNARTAQDDYWGFETLYAGYLMGEINLGSRLVIIPGVRYERVHNEYSAYKVEQGSMTSWFIRDTLTRPADHEHWLPHLHVRFRATDWWDVRFSYNNTLTRPDYNHAVPKVYYQPGEGEGEAGNPYIRPAVSENLDANFTFFSRKLGLITVGGFMKNIKDVFYLQPTILKNIPDSSILAEFPTDTYSSLENGLTQFYVNSPYKGQIMGLEVEWQSNFTWLPSPFNGLVLNVNYTHVWSETNYMQHRVIQNRIPTFPYIENVEVDTFYVNRLLHQANDIANVSLGYDYKGFSARLSFRFQGNVISTINTRPELNEYTNNVYKFDFVVKQKIPFKFADFEVFLNAINFTNVPYMRYSIYPNKGETNTYTRYTGRMFQLGLRLRH